MPKKPKAGAGCWVAEEMETTINGRVVDAIGVFNTETEEFRLHETVGESLEEYCEENDEDYDALYAIYMREAKKWANDLNHQGL